MVLSDMLANLAARKSVL
ncbi:hypothetical protein [Roseburia amylophila]